MNSIIMLLAACEIEVLVGSTYLKKQMPTNFQDLKFERSLDFSLCPTTNIFIYSYVYLEVKKIVPDFMQTEQCNFWNSRFLRSSEVIYRGKNLLIGGTKHMSRLNEI